MEIRWLPDDLIGLGEAGRLAGVSTKTVLGWVRRGLLRGWIRAGTRYLVSRAEVLALFQAVGQGGKER